MSPLLQVYFGVLPSAPNTEAGSNEAAGVTKIASTATISNTKNAKKRLKSLEVAKEYNIKSYDGDFLKYQLGKININELNITKNNLVNVEIQFVKAKYELVFYNSLIKFYLGEVFELYFYI